MKFLKPILISIICIIPSSIKLDSNGFIGINKFEKEFSVSDSNLTESDFNEIINLVQRTYDEVIEQNGLKPLKISGHWKSNVVNAYMKGQLQINLVDVSGALARRKEITPLGFALVVCHEVGHAYGGKPDKRAPLFKASVEGQADYYGMGVCLRKIVDQISDDNIVEVTSYMKQVCLEEEDSQTCEKLLKAGQSAANLLTALKAEPAADYSTPDPTVVRRTLKSYPEKVQCRLDTYLNAVLNMGRPKCWYNK